MSNTANTSQILYVSGFQQLVTTPDHNTINAICWSRNLSGDFFEIIEKAASAGNITVLDPEDLDTIQLSKQGQLARDILQQDFNLLKTHGASPSLNIIKYYERDDTLPFFSTDVYSYHVDRSPVPTHTFLCTYYGQASDILPNTQAIQKIHVPEIRAQLKQLYHGPEHDFDAFLEEHFFDLHYQAIQGALPVNLGRGNMWRLAVDHPQMKVPPCIHRAPKELPGESRLLMIC